MDYDEINTDNWLELQSENTGIFLELLLIFRCMNIKKKQLLIGWRESVVEYLIWQQEQGKHILVWLL